MNGAVPCLCAPSNVLCYAEKCGSPPPNPYISEMAPSCRFQKVYTYPPPPPGDDMFAHGSKTCRKCRKVPKPTKLGYSECPREICNGFLHLWTVHAHNALGRATSAVVPINFCKFGCCTRKGGGTECEALLAPALGGVGGGGAVGQRL